MRGLYTPENLGEVEPFFAGPFQNFHLLKAEEEGSKWVVFLEASNENEDLEEDVTVMKALKEASDHYLSKGVISWDHKHKPDPRNNYPGDPQCIIGEPTDVAFSETRSTLVKGILYKENKKAQGVWENVLSRTSRFGASISGYILKKAVELGKRFIRRVYWDDTAITYKPVNDTTMGHVQLLPFAEFAKSLTAGAGVDAGTMTGGRALTRESLQGKSVSTLFRDFLVLVKGGKLSTYDETRGWVMSRGFSEDQADKVLEFIFSKLTMKA